MELESTRRFSSLYRREFRMFFISQVISLTGTWMQATALGWLVYSLTSSPIYLGLVGMSLSLPVFLFSSIGGFLADRLKKRNVLLFTQGLPIIPVLVLSFLTNYHLITVGEIVVITFLLGCLNAVDIPVRQSFLIEIAGRENLLNAVAMQSSAFHGARAVGAIIAGFAIKEFGSAFCFYLNALSWLPVIYVLLRIKPQPSASCAESKGFFKDILEGFLFVKGNKQILYLILTISIYSLLGMPFSQFLPVIVRTVFGSDAQTLGYMMSAVGAGSLAAGLMIAFRCDNKGNTYYMTISAFCFPALLFSFTFVDTVWAALVFLAAIGWSAVSFLARANSFIQLSVSDDLRGRVMSIFALVFLGMMPLGYALMGYLISIVGVRYTFAACSILCMIGFLLFRGKWNDHTSCQTKVKALLVL
ncbi:major facilitator superfamily transporter [Candidatus Magnetoovum chiemensis]|nr:major facilitator superfamily transporter [Candidatus Magnetoovum chiemensis]